MQHIDILIDGGTLVTMDPQRRVLEDHSVAVDRGRILAVGPATDMRAAYRPAKRIDARRHAVMPGLIDLHAHAGTALIKQIAEHLPGPQWRNVFDFISYHASRDWWHLEAMMASLEKMKFGTTTSLYMLGNAPRSDNPDYAYANAEGVAKVGIRSVVGVGPSRPPYPRDYTYWDQGRRVDRLVTFEQSLEMMDETIGSWKSRADDKIQMWASTSRLLNENPADPVYDPANAKYVQPQLDALQNVMQKHDVGFHVHGYGTAVKFMQERAPRLLGPKTVLGHGWPLDMESAEIMAETGTRVGHCPRAHRVYLFEGRCPVPEMIDMGVVVGLGSDFVGTDRSWNLWEDIYWSPRIHRRLKNDPTYMPVGKMLEMATIDGAKALGLDHRIGSIEMGKDADIILVDMWKAQTVPLCGPLTTERLAYYARGEDVDTVMVQGNVLMEAGRVVSVNEDDLLEWADAEARHTVEVFGLAPLMQRDANYWKAARH